MEGLWGPFYQNLSGTRFCASFASKLVVVIEPIPALSVIGRSIIFAFLYPALLSFKALEQGSAPWNEAKEWLTYWVHI